jgi:hypothetical protein
VLLVDAFNHLFTKYKDVLFRTQSEYTEHNLFTTIKEKIRGTTTAGEVKTADEAFAKYILDAFPQTNREYFLFTTKFSILFRECINKFKPCDQGDYTMYNTAESVPDLCNEFITEFMEQYDYFGMDTNELIEIIQHFCHWLYENKFTTSRLTLLG